MKNGKRILSVTIERILDENPDTSYLYQDGFEERLQDLEDGAFCYVGIRADAEISIPLDSDTFLTQHIRSGGLWGIESDSDKAHFKSIEKEELSDLKTGLTALGFSTRAISKAFQNIERKDS